jgi:hypothetical protein
MNLLKPLEIECELTPNGAIDRYMTFDEYLDNEGVQELRTKMYTI